MNGFNSSEIVEIKASDIHNGQFSRTELAHKERMEKMTKKVNKAFANRKGQLSVIALEAEQEWIMDEERRNAAKAMRRETKNRYGW